jgi:hypothetical protein
MASALSIVELVPFLERLRKGNIPFELSSHREGTVLVHVAVPGARYEAEFSVQSPEVNVEVFRSDGAVLGRAALDAMIRENAVEEP